MLLTPAMSVTMSENMVLSPDGYCKVFDASANGYGRGEAVNAIYIKPLSQALADGDHVRAIIQATSVNYDGRSAKIFAPDIDSQERLIRQAYSRARINDISQTAFVECHGTGTKVGDIVETTAIARVFGEKGVHIGSVCDRDKLKTALAKTCGIGEIKCRPWRGCIGINGPNQGRVSS